MSRRTAREEAFKLLYQIDVQKESDQNILDVFYEEYEQDEKDRTYISDVVAGVTKSLSEIDEIIQKSSTSWKTNRISKVNMAILRLAVYEMLKREDIPTTVSINEAVELTKTYDSIESGAFVNGVLDSVQKILNKSPTR